VSNGAYNKGIKAYLADDFAAALACWQPLADAGHGPSAYRIGYMHETGQGVPLDATAAAAWYEKAAGAGDADAMAALGSLYLHGIGVPQDYSRAYVMLSLAVALGATGSIALRNRAASFLSSDQLASLEQEARRRFAHRPT
jgi:TPR repeat protein